MGKLKFFAIFLCVSIVVQAVHVHFDEIERQRAAGRQLHIDFPNVIHAFTVVPMPGMLPPILTGGAAVGAAVGSAAAAAPIGVCILAALAVGGTVAGAYWLFQYGKEDAYVQMHDVQKDGLSVSQLDIQKAIAEFHGVDTTGPYQPVVHTPDWSNYTGLESQRPQIGDYVYYNGYSYKITGLYTIIGAGQTSSVGISISSGTMRFRYGIAYPQYWYYYQNMGAGALTPPPVDFSFEPSDYPELYEGDNLLRGLLDYYGDNPDLEFLTRWPTEEKPADAVVPVGPTVPLASMSEQGWAVDQYGNYWPALPGGVAEVLAPPQLDEENTDLIDIQYKTADGQKVDTKVAVPLSFAQELLDAGIRGKIDDVGDGWATWVDPVTGARITTRTTSTLSKKISAMRDSASIGGGNNNSTNTVYNPDDPEPDPGNPDDPSFTTGAIFDPTFDWGQNRTFNVSEHVSVVENLPMVNLVKGSSLSLAIANPVLSVYLASWPGGPITLEVDFSQWEPIWNVMGPLIYFFALINSLSYALLGKRA